MKENAIRVSNHCEKVAIDFSTYNALKETSGFARLYTVSTAATERLTKTLGFPIGGFCDDRGKGGTPLAARLSGYDEIPSDLILCRMGPKGDYRPLTQHQIEALFFYLKEGKVTPPSKEDEAIYFFEKHRIGPIVPDFPYPMIPVFFMAYANLIALSYKIEESEMEHFEPLRKAFIEKVRANLDSDPFHYTSKDKKYYLDTLFHEGRFYCLIQAVNQNDEDSRIPWIAMGKELLQNRPPWAQNPHIDDED